MDPLHALGIVALLALTIRVAGSLMDHDKIRRDLANRGGVIESIEWTPFRSRQDGDWSERRYSVIIAERDGSRFRASYAGSLFGGLSLRKEEMLTPPSGRELTPESQATDLNRS